MGLVIVLLCITTVAFAATKTDATILVKDTLAIPGQLATIEARLTASTGIAMTGLGGEPIELLINGNVVARGMTGGDGKVFLHYRPPKQGQKGSTIRVRVRLGNSSRVLPVEGEAHLAVWEQRDPILVVELASLMEQPTARLPVPLPLPLIGATRDLDWKPMPDAAQELAKLTQFYYRVIYVAWLPSPDADGFRVIHQTRTWLAQHQFPPGYVLVLPSGGMLGEKLDALREAGWKTLKVGIGRSKVFVETFLERRLAAIMVPEPSGEVPPKTRVAKDWKEVRKKI
ncbi:MAG: hypothetical protein NNA23_09075 [Nitrospira sp.]|nr:hypothetical protein [Nitrospira sp.]